MFGLVSSFCVIYFYRLFDYSSISDYLQNSQIMYETDQLQHGHTLLILILSCPLGVAMCLNVASEFISIVLVICAFSVNLEIIQNAPVYKCSMCTDCLLAALGYCIVSPGKYSKCVAWEKEML